MLFWGFFHLLSICLDYVLCFFGNSESFFERGKHQRRLIISLSLSKICEEACNEGAFFHCHGLVSDFNPLSCFPGAGCEKTQENQSHLLPLICFDVVVFFNLRLGESISILLGDTSKPEIKEFDASLILIGLTLHSFPDEVNSDHTGKDNFESKVDLDEVNHKETVLTVGHRVLLAVSVESEQK